MGLTALSPDLKGVAKGISNPENPDGIRAETATNPKLRLFPTKNGKVTRNRNGENPYKINTFYIMLPLLLYFIE